MSYAGDAVLL